MSIGKPTGRKPGRPRRYGQGRINATVRFTPERYATLRAEAERSRRSISEEVEARIERSFTDDVLDRLSRDVGKIFREANEIAAELLERYKSRVTELEARIQELESPTILSEETIERAVERAIGRAFAKMGGIK